MREYLSAGLAAVVLLGGFFAGSEAAAFKRTETCDSYGTYECDPGETPKPISWPVRCVRYRVNDDGSSDFGSGEKLTDELKTIVFHAFGAWNAPDCSDFQLVQGPATSNGKARYRRKAGFDGNMNLVVWRDTKWPHQGSRWAFALTSVTYDSDSGTITDADIELNTAQYEFAHLSKSQVDKDEPKVDMLNTLTHEVGHFVGLDHPDNGKATMYGRAPPGEIEKRTLHEDDINGICAIYPKQSPPATCNQPKDFKPPRVFEKKNQDKGCFSSMTGRGVVPISVVGAWLGMLVVGCGFRRRTKDDGGA